MRTLRAHDYPNFQNNFFDFMHMLGGMLGVILCPKTAHGSGSGHDLRRWVLQRPGEVCYNGHG